MATNLKEHNAAVYRELEAMMVDHREITDAAVGGLENELKDKIEAFQEKHGVLVTLQQASGSGASYSQYGDLLYPPKINRTAVFQIDMRRKGQGR